MLGDFNAQLGNERKFRDITWPHIKHKRSNKNGEKLIDFCRNFRLIIMSTQFQKPRQKLTTWRSPDLRQGEYQIDHVAISRKNTKEILNVSLVNGTFESDHHLLQIKVKFQPNRRLKRPPKNIKPDPEYLKSIKKKSYGKLIKRNPQTYRNSQRKFRKP